MHTTSTNQLPTGFSRIDGVLHCEQIALTDVVARWGSPTYVYSLAHIRERIDALISAFGAREPLLCFAVKANDNHEILARCAAAGTGFDVVSGGELQRALRTGVDPAKIVFSGVGKTDAELRAAIDAGILSINAESEAEVERIIQLASSGTQPAPVSLRVNPDVDPKTHPKIATGMANSKFGVSREQAVQLYRRLADAANVEIVGLAFHIGSQLRDAAPVVAAIERTLQLVHELAATGIQIPRLDIGGGLGIAYAADEDEPDVDRYISAICSALEPFSGQIVLEPGRFIVGNAGVMCARVIYNKANPAGDRIAVLDAAMNDLLRPALYDAQHRVVTCDRNDTAPLAQTLVGPICESSDVFATAISMPELQTGDAVAFLGAGAYGTVMASTYNSRGRPAEVLVDGDRCALLRPRESVADQLARDIVAPQWQNLNS